ncbi:hypothetical protein [Micromonospora sp. WMMD812]|uniref:hypothetical protein n=1 Tax=Micromonospora sp. WMMD812 TaxID=3015152 RepID=UPI00248B14CB|nr:hypothetical protein [Micromonospora sp. WMMD812]WBB66102.1 hypothetical protein O7603_23435 [Micromonospora sp. WMMD812]
MPPRPHRPSCLAWQAFRGSDAVRQGLLTRHQLRGASWVRLLHDVYADARLDRDHRLACQAALLRLPPGTIIAGPSAVYLHGIEHAATFADDVHVLLPRATRVGSHRGIRVHTVEPAINPAGTGPSTTGGRPLGNSGGMTTSDPAGAAWETAVWLEPLRAVGIVDSLLREGLTSRDTLAVIAHANADRPGGRRARWVFGLADPGAQAPPESHLRVRLVLAGMPRPVAQHPVRLAGGLVLHPDLAWPEYRVAVDYDGQWHADPDRLHTDRRRLNQLAAGGWLVLHVTSRRLHNDFPGLVREVRTALAARGWRR